MNPNTLNLDPDTGFWPNLDPDPSYAINFKIKNSFSEKLLHLKRYLYFERTLRTKCNLKNFLSVESLNCEFIYKILHLSTLFYLIFTGVDPDPQHG